MKTKRGIPSKPHPRDAKTTSAEIPKAKKIAIAILRTSSRLKYAHNPVRRLNTAKTKGPTGRRMGIVCQKITW